MPTYAGRFPRLLHNYLNKISANNTLGAATFITEHSSSSKLATGRPNVDDLKFASNFGLDIAKRLKEINSSTDLNSLSLPGNQPYVVKNISMPPITPETDTKCVTCRICTKHCPTSAIDFSDCKTIDATKCIKCNSCVKKCPFNAKSITHQAYKNMLVINFSDNPRNPEIFLA